LIVSFDVSPSETQSSSIENSLKLSRTTTASLRRTAGPTGSTSKIQIQFDLEAQSATKVKSATQNKIENQFLISDQSVSNSNMLSRSESLAYPKTGTLAKIQYLLRRYTRALVATFSLVAFVLILSLDSAQRKSTGAGVSLGLRNM
jgi:hypothetical protein